MTDVPPPPPAEPTPEPQGSVPPPPPPYAATPAPQGTMSDSDARLYAALGHAGNILFPAIAPLIVWLIGKDKSSFVDQEGKSALNFGILLVIGYVISSFLFVVIIGALLWFVVFVIALIFGIRGAISANKGESFKYPFNVNWVK